MKAGQNLPTLAKGLQAKGSIPGQIEDKKSLESKLKTEKQENNKTWRLLCDVARSQEERVCVVTLMRPGVVDRREKVVQGPLGEVGRSSWVDVEELTFL